MVVGGYLLNAQRFLLGPRHLADLIGGAVGPGTHVDRDAARQLARQIGQRLPERFVGVVHHGPRPVKTYVGRSFRLGTHD